MKLIFDTETTGLAKFNLPDNHPEQPRLVQLGMMVLDDSWEVVHEVGLIIKPEGFTIPDVVAGIHGITTEKALKYGVPLKSALHLFSWIIEMCDTVVAHNLKFDKLVIGSELVKNDMFIFPIANEYCTMMATTPILNLTQKNGRTKWPKLSEAYEYFFSEPLLNAHDALTDVRACARIYKHLMTYPSTSKSIPMAEDPSPAPLLQP